MGHINEQEFRDLYEEYRVRIYRYLLKHSGNADVAEDLTQDVFLKIFNARDSFDPDKGTFSAWAYRIAHNTFLNFIKKTEHSRRDQAYEGDMEQFSSPAQGHANEVEGEMLLSEIKAAILCLPEPERSVLYNKEIAKKTLEETARELDLSVRTISRRLLSAYELVREELKKRSIGLE